MIIFFNNVIAIIGNAVKVFSQWGICFGFDKKKTASILKRSSVFMHYFCMFGFSRPYPFFLSSIRSITEITIATTPNAANISIVCV